MLNKKLIFLLSLFGLAMGLFTLLPIPIVIEMIVWLVIFVFSGYQVGNRAPGKYFLHGFYINMLNSAWVTSVHILFFNTYLSNHWKEAFMLLKYSKHLYPDFLLLVLGILFGVLFGCLLGLFSSIAGKRYRKRPVLIL